MLVDHQIFEEMLEVDCAPNLVVYHALISALGRAGMWREALDIYHTRLVRMRACPLCCDCLLSMFCLSSQWPSMDRIHLVTGTWGCEFCKSAGTGCVPLPRCCSIRTHFNCRNTHA